MFFLKCNWLAIYAVKINTDQRGFGWFLVFHWFIPFFPQNVEFAPSVDESSSLRHRAVPNSRLAPPPALPRDPVSDSAHLEARPLSDLLLPINASNLPSNHSFTLPANQSHLRQNSREILNSPACDVETMKSGVVGGGRVGRRICWGGVRGGCFFGRARGGRGPGLVCSGAR